MERVWHIEMLGGLRALPEGADAHHSDTPAVTRFRTRKAAALLAYLAYHAECAHPRDLLVELLWPECWPGRGHGNLSRELTWLRGQLELAPTAAGTVILADRRTVRLSPAAVSVDVAAFEAALRAARFDHGSERIRRLAAAVALYGGELLPGCGETWVVPERLRLAEAFLGAMHEIVAAREQAGDLSGALQLAWRAAGVDPLREQTHADLMRLLAATGQRETALRLLGAAERRRAPGMGSQGTAAANRRASGRERLVEQRAWVQAAEAEELRRQLALRTAETEELRRRLQSEMAETRRLRQELAVQGAANARSRGLVPVPRTCSGM